MITCDRSEESLRKVIALGADACLVKPLLMAPLVNKVKEIFNKLRRTNPTGEKMRGPGSRGQYT